MVLDVWNELAAVDELPLYETYRCLDQANSALTNIALYIEHTNWRKLFMYELQAEKLPNMLKSLPDSIVAVL